MKIQHRIDLEVFGLQSRFTNWKQMQSILQFLFIWLVIDSVYFPNEHVKNTHEIYMEIALFIRINWAIIQWPIRCYKIFPMLCDLSYVKQIRTRCSIPPNRIYPLKKLPQLVGCVRCPPPFSLSRMILLCKFCVC